MSNGTPPVQPAPVPPSVAGIPQPVYASGSATAPTAASWFPQAPVGTWLPPPQVGMGGNAPFPTPVVPAAPVPPSVAGIPQPVFVPPGSATVPPASALFPAFTAPGPNPAIVMVTTAPPPPIPLPLPTTPGTSPIPIALGGWGLYAGPNPATPWPKIELDEAA